jgi:UTP-glucose-1-phosphate uridylyltransferase
MSKGIAAMSYLDPAEIVFASGNPCSIPAIKAGLNKVAQMQQEGTADGTYSAEPCLMNQPFASCSWDIVVADGNVAGDYQLTFNAEETFRSDSLNRAALSTRRPIDFGLAANTNEFTVRSVLAVLKFIEKLEDKVAKTGVGATGDATYTNIVLNGSTPYESFTWTVTKLGDVYTVVSTASS